MLMPTRNPNPLGYAIALALYAPASLAAQGLAR